MSTYREIADLYDALYSWKDYAAEARRLKDLLVRSGENPGGTVLDVPSGTGTHQTYLTKWFRVSGVDASAPMLAQARRKLPRVPLYRGRMQTFRLGRKYDAVLCLFSAIGYVRSVGDLETTLRNFLRHLAEGGVLVIDPWLEPSDFLPRHVHLLTVDRPDLKIARVSAARREGDRSILEMRYVVARPGSTRHIKERHSMLLVPRAHILVWLRAQGLSVRTYRKGLTGRGLIVARSRRSRASRSR